uniref:Tau-AnmTx Ueq 12-1 n=1 Tax=Urticina eques TaxID=417072 RepID=TX121_URTEQ|nr:RecName: Full=Tau-AnmTx Ueq 12-1; Short=Ueq 12-1; Flags: Precursor [Urticina eques]SCA59377.1 tau-AnmTx Ueq 12-1 [Urticina eques]
MCLLMLVLGAMYVQGWHSAGFGKRTLKKRCYPGQPGCGHCSRPNYCEGARCESGFHDCGSDHWCDASGDRCCCA